MFIIYKFDNVLCCTRFDDIDYKDGHIQLSNDYINIISVDTFDIISYNYIVRGCYRDLKYDLSSKEFKLDEE